MELGQALAAKLGLQAEIIGFKAGEDMGDDLRNMVWKGHYLRGEPADVMLPRTGGPGVRQGQRAGPHLWRLPAGGDGHGAGGQPHPGPQWLRGRMALEVFTREKIGVEGDTLGRLLPGRRPCRGDCVPTSPISVPSAKAVKALQEDSVAAVMAPFGRAGRRPCRARPAFAVEECQDWAN